MNKLIEPSKIIIQKATQFKNKTPNGKLSFGSIFTDHMLEIDWNEQNGWDTPYIKPYGNLSLSPAATVLHYAVECFEGMKAYKDKNNQIRLFRPELNMERFAHSMKRLCLPEINPNALLECIEELVKLDHEWIPKEDGYSLYIRPTAIGTNPHIGVNKPTSAKIFVILSPVGPYYPEGFNPVKLYADDKYVRAWPGGTGNYKLGSNYGPTILPALEAHDKGYSQILWLFGKEQLITEVGTMNLFIHWINKSGEKELVTSPLSRGDILPGVTRRCVIDCCEEWNEFKVEEKEITIFDIIEASKENRLIEIFGTGTAAVVSPVSVIHYKGKDINIPLAGTDGKAGKLAERLWRELMDIQYGRKSSPWAKIIA